MLVSLRCAGPDRISAPGVFCPVQPRVDIGRWANTSAKTTSGIATRKREMLIFDTLIAKTASAPIGQQVDIAPDVVPIIGEIGLPRFTRRINPGYGINKT